MTGGNSYNELPDNKDSYSSSSSSINNSEHGKNSLTDEQPFTIFKDVFIMGYVPPWVPIVYVVINILIFIFGVAGNILIIVIYQRGKSKKPCDWFILFIAYMDLIVCTCYPWLNLRLELHWDMVLDYHGFICALQHLVNFSAMLSSSFILSLMALERYVKVCRPSIASLTGDTAKLICYGIIGVSVLLAVYPCYLLISKANCTVMGKIQDAYVIIVLCIFCTCFFIVTVSYANVIRTIELKIKVKQRLLSHDGLHDGVINNQKTKVGEDGNDSDSALRDDNDEVFTRKRKQINCLCLTYCSKRCFSNDENLQGKEIKKTAKIKVDEIEKSQNHHGTNENHDMREKDRDLKNKLNSNNTKGTLGNQGKPLSNESMELSLWENTMATESDCASFIKADHLDAIQSVDQEETSRKFPLARSPAAVTGQACKIVSLGHRVDEDFQNGLACSRDGIYCNEQNEEQNDETLHCTSQPKILNRHSSKDKRQGNGVCCVSCELCSEEAANNIVLTENHNEEGNDDKTSELCTQPMGHTDHEDTTANGSENENLSSQYRSERNKSTGIDKIDMKGGATKQRTTFLTVSKSNCGRRAVARKDESTNANKDRMKLKLQRSDDSYFGDEDLYSDIQPRSFFLRRSNEKMQDQQEKAVKKKANNSSTSHKRKKWMKERRMTLMLLSITFVFLISWIPPWALILCLQWDHQPFESHMAVRIAYRYWEKMTLLQYCTNYIIYYIFNPGFRKNVNKLFTFNTMCKSVRRVCCCVSRSESLDLDHAPS